MGLFILFMVENSEKNVLIKKSREKCSTSVHVLKVQKKSEYSQVGATTYESVIYCQKYRKFHSVLIVTAPYTNRAKSIHCDGNLFFTRSRRNRARKQPIASKIRITLTASHGRANANMRANKPREFRGKTPPTAMCRCSLRDLGKTFISNPPARFTAHQNNDLTRCVKKAVVLFVILCKDEQKLKQL